LAELFPDDVRRFIDRYVESIDQLEILRLLWENPAAEWTEAALAAEVQAPPQAVAAHLAALAARGLLRVKARGGGAGRAVRPR
jgi:predicted ArsR family transcriptional regulator